MPSSPLTPRQRQIVAFIRRHRQAHGVAPTVAELQEAFAFRSPNAVTAHLAALERKGAITRVPGQARNIRLTGEVPPAPPAMTVPLLGSIPAGFAELADEAVERQLSLDAALLGCPPQARLFALRVRGDSMVNAGIFDGDLVVLEHGPTPRDGEIVAALLDGETTLKRYRRGTRAPYLQAENPAYPAMIPVAELVIQGVFRALIRLSDAHGRSR